MHFKITRHENKTTVDKLEQGFAYGEYPPPPVTSRLTPQTFALLPEMACCCFESRPMTMQRVIRIWRPWIQIGDEPQKIRHL